MTPAPVRVTAAAVRGSTFPLIVRVTGGAPASATYTLLDRSGAVVNGRLRADLTGWTPAEDAENAYEATLTLTGDDLRPEGARLWVMIEATYDSDLGEGLPLIGSAVIAVADPLPASAAGDAL